MATFFISIPKIEIEVIQGGQSSLSQQQYVLDDRRAIWRSEFVKRANPKTNNEPKDALSGTGYEVLKRSISQNVKEQNDIRFPCIHNKDVVDLDFHSVKRLPWKNHDAVPSC